MRTPAARQVLASLALLFVIQSAAAVTREYEFRVQHAIANPDGFPRTVIAVLNESDSLGRAQRLLPGPLIYGKKGDEIIVRFHNHLDTEAIAVHFHGLHMKGQAFQDGAAGVTQPFVQPDSKWTYRFTLTQTGTYWYHAHAGIQYQEGLFGPLVADYPDDEVDPVKARYNYFRDQVILVHDWFHERNSDLLTAMHSPINSFKYSNGDKFQPSYAIPPRAVLINGHGRYDCSQINNQQCFNLTLTGCPRIPICYTDRRPHIGRCDSDAHPPEEFSCRSGRNARFRLINPGTEWPIEFWIEQHSLTVVARDGLETEPQTFSRVSIMVAERLDVIVNCNGAPSDRYAIWAQIRHNGFRPVIYSKAVLNYEAADPNGVVLGAAPPATPNFLTSHSDFEYKLRPLERKLSHKADRRLVYQFKALTGQVDGDPFRTVIINNITFIHPLKPLTEVVYLGQSVLTAQNIEAPGRWGNRRETHIVQAALGETVEVVLISLNEQSHPWHLHGHHVDLIAHGKLNADTDFTGSGPNGCLIENLHSITDAKLAQIVKPLDQRFEVLQRADTFAMESFSYAVFRVRFDNPGPWMFHCHIDWHLRMGMGLIFSVERNGRYDLQNIDYDFAGVLSLRAFKEAITKADKCPANPRNKKLDPEFEV